MAHREIPNASPFSCIGKERHETGQIAARVAKAMAKKGRSGASYRCGICLFWHIGRHGKGGRQLVRRPR